MRRSSGTSRTKNRLRTSPDEEVSEFNLDGERALLLTDYSHIWDGGRGHPGENAVALLDHVQQRLEDLAGGKEGAAELANLWTPSFGHVGWRLFGDGFSVWELAIQTR